MARLPLIAQSVRRKRISIALTIWLQICKIACWFLLTLGASHSLHTYRPMIRSYILDFYAKRDYVKRLIFYDCDANVSLNDMDVSATELQPDRYQGGSSSSKKKKKNSDASDHFSSSVHDAATLLAENMRAIGEQISRSIVSDVVVQQKSEEFQIIQEKATNLYPTLYEIEGLTLDERYRALSKIPDHPTQMLVFFSLPSDVRLEWVRRFLADH
ncbi:hypothetical protein Gotur_035817 [Gossypium turneri]